MKVFVFHINRNLTVKDFRYLQKNFNIPINNVNDLNLLRVFPNNQKEEGAQKNSYFIEAKNWEQAIQLVERLIYEVESNQWVQGCYRTFFSGGFLCRFPMGVTVRVPCPNKTRLIAFTESSRSNEGSYTNDSQCDIVTIAKVADNWEDFSRSYSKWSAIYLLKWFITEKQEEIVRNVGLSMKDLYFNRPEFNN